MRIVVTGAGGFVGRNLVSRLSQEHDVVATDTRLNGHAGIEGDLCDSALIEAVFAGGCDAVFHLATMPGGAAELDPDGAKRVNVDATVSLIDAAARTGSAPRFVFASSIAVLGDPLPPEVDDACPLKPTLVYGAHKAMMETWIDNRTRRGAIKGLSLRLPGIIARPKGPSGMKSAFMSDVFHAFSAGDAITLPVGREATMWLMSLDCLVDDLLHALENEATGAMTLPACRASMGDMVTEIAAQTGTSASLVSFAPDPALEAAFGCYPPLLTPLAQSCGFSDDGGLLQLVASALSSLR